MLLDEAGLGADQLQTLCYRLCHTFVRATKSVGVVPPIYYADMAAERGKLIVKFLSGGSDTESQASSGGAGRRNGPINVHNNVRFSMFFT